MEHKDPLAVRFVAGAVAATTAELCTLPMDCSKVRMQTHGLRTSTTVQFNWNVAQHPARFRCKRCRVRKQSLIAAGLVTEGTVGATMGASLVAGFAGAVVSSPLDVIKTRLMAHQNNRHYTGVLDCGRELYQLHGVRAFYKGFAAYYLREAPWCCLFFVTYELVRNSILRPHSITSSIGQPEY
ncbi:hypothetical protein DYB28_009421 [Aphanomyces astaci]|uniref:Uncharacterized protein n=1 Tax=Aphanomyces astaci TaxID=112090 RepID=A0A9X8E7T2_APHAT|nr:hypothetical protein DYB28_009421 [Aphanomyces astaci]